ncbi:hypothetical protein Pelo_5247 [Pelomyxa schiedti]|nr:hypothetical protein Pelo_5247 [Pelomyxa schiedti]
MNCTPLHYAAFKGYFQVLALLLQAGAQLNLVTVCLISTKNLSNCFTLLKYICSYFRIMDKSLSSISFIPDFEKTALDLAVRYSHTECVSLLLEHGAAPVLSDCLDKSLSESQFQCLLLLLRNGAEYTTLFEGNDKRKLPEFTEGRLKVNSDSLPEHFIRDTRKFLMQPSCTLVALILPNSEIADRVAEKLASALKINTSLTTLDLHGNKIQVPGAEKIAQSLIYNSHLLSLNLRGNIIETGLSNLLVNSASSYLQKNVTLRFLSLQGNLSLASLLQIQRCLQDSDLDPIMGSFSRPLSKLALSIPDGNYFNCDLPHCQESWEHLFTTFLLTADPVGSIHIIDLLQTHQEIFREHGKYSLLPLIKGFPQVPDHKAALLLAHAILMSPVEQVSKPHVSLLQHVMVHLEDRGSNLLNRVAHNFVRRSVAQGNTEPLLWFDSRVAKLDLSHLSLSNIDLASTDYPFKFKELDLRTNELRLLPPWLAGITSVLIKNNPLPNSVPTNLPWPKLKYFVREPSALNNTRKMNVIGSTATKIKFFRAIQGAAGPPISCREEDLLVHEQCHITGSKWLWNLWDFGFQGLRWSHLFLSGTNSTALVCVCDLSNQSEYHSMEQCLRSLTTTTVFIGISSSSLLPSQEATSIFPLVRRHILRISLVFICNVKSKKVSEIDRNGRPSDALMGMDTLVNRLENAFPDTLVHIPLSWEIGVRQLSMNEKQVMEWGEFRDLCSGWDFLPGEEEHFRDFLVDSGYIMYLETRRHYVDKEKKQFVVLKPRWLSELIHELISLNMGNEGFFDAHHLVIPKRFGLTADQIIHLLGACQITHKISLDNYAMPELFRSDPPLSCFDLDCSIHCGRLFELESDMLDLFQQVIVCILKTEGVLHDAVWKYGVIVHSESPNEKALVCLIPEKKRIFISVKSLSEHFPSSLLMKLVLTVFSVTACTANKPPKQWVPCPNCLKRDSHFMYYSAVDSNLLPVNYWSLRKCIDRWLEGNYEIRCGIDGAGVLIEDLVPELLYLQHKKIDTHRQVEKHSTSLATSLPSHYDADFTLLYSPFIIEAIPEHPNIAQTCGIRYHNKTFILCVEHIKPPKFVINFLRSDLGTMLSTIKQTLVGNLCEQRKSFDAVLSRELRWKILLDIAQGLNHLHAQVPSIVHADLHSGNVCIVSLDLRDEGPHAKIIDFELAHREGNAFATMGSRQDISFAPEVLAHKPYGTPADVWNYGMIFRFVMDPFTKPYDHLLDDPYFSSYRREVPVQDLIRVREAIANGTVKPSIPTCRKVPGRSHHSISDIGHFEPNHKPICTCCMLKSFERKALDYCWQFEPEKRIKCGHLIPLLRMGMENPDSNISQPTVEAEPVATFDLLPSTEWEKMYRIDERRLLCAATGSLCVVDCKIDPYFCSLKEVVVELRLKTKKEKATCMVCMNNIFFCGTNEGRTCAFDLLGNQSWAKEDRGFSPIVGLIAYGSNSVCDCNEEGLLSLFEVFSVLEGLNTLCNVKLLHQVNLKCKVFSMVYFDDQVIMATNTGCCLFDLTTLELHILVPFPSGEIPTQLEVVHTTPSATSGTPVILIGKCTSNIIKFTLSRKDVLWKPTTLITGSKTTHNITLSPPLVAPLDAKPRGLTIVDLTGQLTSTDLPVMIVWYEEGIIHLLDPVSNEVFVCIRAGRNTTVRYCTILPDSASSNHSFLLALCHGTIKVWFLTWH